MRKVMYAVYYASYETAIHVTVLKGKGDTALVYMDKASRTHKPYFAKRWPTNELKYVKHLHNNAHLQKTASVAIFEPRHEISTTWYMRPAKPHTSLRLRAV